MNYEYFQHFKAMKEAIHVEVNKQEELVHAISNQDRELCTLNGGFIVTLDR
jgi:hypothetical protein